MAELDPIYTIGTGLLDPSLYGSGTFNPTAGSGLPCSYPRVCGTGGHRRWEMKRGRDGNREYSLKYRVEVQTHMGPGTALFAPGLPVPGTPWVFTGGGERDFYAYCTHDVQVTQVAGDGDGPNFFFDVTYTFTTAPQETCFLSWNDDPVLRPVKTDGNFVRYNEEATKDRFGNAILSSSWERMTGPKVEFDANRPQIKLEFYTTTLNLATLCAYIDGVNDATLWGFATRCVKFSACSWRKLYRGNCSVLYHKVMEFDVNTNTFDREVLDEGTKVLHGQWSATKDAWVLKPIAVDATTGTPIMPDYQNPTHFMRYADRNANVTRIILNGFGVPWNPGHYTSGTGTASLGTSDDNKGYIHVEKYPSRNLLLLGIPAAL